MKRLITLLILALPVFAMAAKGHNPIPLGELGLCPELASFDTGGTLLRATWVYDAIEYNGALYVATDSTANKGKLYRIRSTDTTVVTTFARSCLSVGMFADTMLVGLGSVGLVLRSENLGVSWDTTFKPDGVTNVYKVFPDVVRGEVLLGTGSNGDVFRSNYMYALAESIPGPTWVYSVRDRHDTLYMCTDYNNAEVWRSVDGGQTWQFYYLFPGSRVYDIFWAGDTAYVGMDNSFGVMRSTNGTTWNNVWKPDGATNVYCFFQPSYTQDFLIGTGNNGDAFRSNYHFDTTCVMMTGPTWVYDVEEFGSWLLSGTDYTNGELWKTQDSGRTWANLPGWSYTKVLSLQTIGSVIYAGTDNQGNVYASRDSGATWDTTGNLANASAVYALTRSSFVLPGRMLAGTGSNGDVFVSDTILGHDAAAVRILAPGDSVRFDSTVIPKAVVVNCGQDPVTFWARFYIGTDYVDSQSVSLNPGRCDTVEFRQWQAGPTGTQAMRCTTMLAGDMFPENDRVLDSVRVYVGSGVEQAGELPRTVALEVAGSNPLRGAGWMRYALPSPSGVKLNICSVEGRVVRTLVSEARPAGVHTVAWDLCDDLGRSLPVGTYFCRLVVDGRQSLTRKLVVLR